MIISSFKLKKNNKKENSNLLRNIFMKELSEKEYALNKYLIINLITFLANRKFELMEQYHHNKLSS